MSSVGRAREKLTPAQVSLAGAASGAITRLLCQPLDVAKIRLQLQTESGAMAKYRGFVHLTFTLPREEGLLALWKGHIPAQVLSITYGVASFAVFESMTSRLSSVEQQPGTRLAVDFLCGGLAGCAGTLASAPFDVLRTRFVAQASPVYSSSYDATVKLWREGGLKAFYKGVTPAILMVAPRSGMEFAFYSFFASVVSSFSVGRSSFSVPESLSCGGLAGLAAKTLLYPLDVIKKRLQVSGWDSGRVGLGDTLHYRGLLHCGKDILIREGLQGIFKGYTPAAVKAVSTSSLHFGVYEYVCRLIILRGNF